MKDQGVACGEIGYCQDFVVRVSRR